MLRTFRSPHDDLPAATARRKKRFTVSRRLLHGVSFAALTIALGIGGESLLHVKPGIGEPAWASSPAGEPNALMTLEWRDDAGKIHAATIEQSKVATFLAQQSTAVAQQRDLMHTAVAGQLTQEIKGTFDVIRNRVPLYADWYFGYWTKYVLMSRALRAALTHATMKMKREDSIGPAMDLVHSIAASLTEYLKRQFAERVLVPTWSEGQIEASFGRAMTTIHEKWSPFLDNQNRQLVEFVQRESTPIDVSAIPADSSRADRPPPPPLLGSSHHQDVFDVFAFRSGLLKIAVQRPRATLNGPVPDQEAKGETEEGQDKIAGVIVNLFSAVVDPVAARGGDLVVSVAAGGLAGAVGSNMGLAGAAGGAAAVAPVTAVIGGLVSMSTDFAASKFEERLTRPSFEKSISDIVDSIEASVDKTLIAVLDEHIDAWHGDVMADTAINRLEVKQ